MNMGQNCRPSLQDLLDDGGSGGKDASGNPILKDVGLFLRSELKKYFKDGDVKYIVSVEV